MTNVISIIHGKVKPFYRLDSTYSVDARISWNLNNSGFDHTTLSPIPHSSLHLVQEEHEVTAALQCGDDVQCQSVNMLITALKPKSSMPLPALSHLFFSYFLLLICSIANCHRRGTNQSVTTANAISYLLAAHTLCHPPCAILLWGSLNGFWAILRMFVS